MEEKFYKNWIIVLVVLVVIDILWHKVIFGSFYNTNFVGVARLINGSLSPLIQYIILGAIMGLLLKHLNRGMNAT